MQLVYRQYTQHTVVNALSIGVVWYRVGGLLAVYKTGDHHLSCEILVHTIIEEKHNLSWPRGTTMATKLLSNLNKHPKTKLAIQLSLGALVPVIPIVYWSYSARDEREERRHEVATRLR